MKARGLLLLLPFGLVAWAHWLRCIQQGRRAQAAELHAPSLKRRELLLTRRSRLRWLHRKRATAEGVLPNATSELSPGGEEGLAPIGGVDVAELADRRPTCHGRKPFHVLLTATGQVYQQWQCRVMYYHWKKQRANDPAGACTEMTGFSRLVATPRGAPDGLEGEIPSIFVKEFDPSMQMRFHGYRVINRPHSVVQLIETPELWKRIEEDYIYIAETDHILMHPIPNLASLGSPMAYVRACCRERSRSRVHK